MIVERLEGSAFNTTTQSALQRKESRRNNGRESQKAADRARTAKAETAQ